MRAVFDYRGACPLTQGRLGRWVGFNARLAHGGRHRAASHQQTHEQDPFAMRNMYSWTLHTGHEAGVSNRVPTESRRHWWQPSLSPVMHRCNCTTALAEAVAFARR